MNGPPQDLCKHFGICGGCDSQNIPYTEQLIDKDRRLKGLFSRFDVKEFKPVIPSPQIFHYRNKMEYAVGSDKGDIFIGLRQKKKFYRIVDIEECRIFSEGVKEVFDILKAWIKTHGLEPYQLRRRSGVIRYAALRHSKHYDELMVVIVVASKEFSADPLIDRLKSVKNVKSVYLCVNEKPADVAVAGDLIPLYGEAYIKERVNGIDYIISPGSFFQTNSYCCGELYRAIKDEAERFGANACLSGSPCGEAVGRQALDVCCGAGGITLAVAGIFEKVTGVDISQANIDDARENMRLNNIGNAEFICADAEEFILRSIESGFMKGISTVIADPPRSGLTKKARAALADSGVENLIYVSCNPANLAQDLQTLVRSYAIEKMIPVDMFPHTRHIEVIAILKANKV